MNIINAAVTYLNAHPEDLIALSGLLSVLLQYAINNVKAFSKLSNAVMGVIAIPGLVTIVAALGTSLHATSYPVIAVLGQIIYHTYEAWKRRQERQLLAGSDSAKVELESHADATEALVTEY